MSTFNAGNDKTRTFDAASGNRTFDAKSPNKTFNTRSPNKTFSSKNSNRTFNTSATNRTFNVNNPNITFDANQNPMQTFNVDSTNRTFPIQKTFNTSNPEMQTFNVTVPGMQTYNIQSPGMQAFSTRNQTYDAQSPLNQTFDIEDPIYGPESLKKQLTADEKKLINKIEVLCNEIRSFIMSIYKFFCNNHTCNWEAVYTLIGEIDLTTQSMINEIFLQQMRIEDEREATRYSSDQTSSNFLPSTFNSQSTGYDDSSEYENQSILDNLRRRLDGLNVSNSADSLVAGLMNINRAEGNLRRFKNFENLNNLFYSQQE